MAGHQGVALVGGRRGRPCADPECDHLQKDHQQDQQRKACTIPGCNCQAYRRTQVTAVREDLSPDMIRRGYR